MATHAAPANSVTLTDLRSCESPHDVFELFRKLRYPVEPEVDVSVESDELPGALRDGIVARYPLAIIVGTRPGDPRLDVTLFVLRRTDKAGPMALARGIAQLWPRHFAGNHLLVFAIQSGTGEFERLIFVNARRMGDGATIRIKLHKLIVERVRPTRHDADTLNRISPPSPTTSADDLYRIQCEAFDVERLTDEFYREYARRFNEVKDRVKEDNKGIQALYDKAKLHTFTQRLFGRMMFLYFLQKKGALNDQQDFITTRYLDAVKSDENFYRDVLEPLFFQTLNRERGPDAASRFGRVPYLNGGLFASDGDDHQGLVYLANDLFDPHSDVGLLNFLNRYNFTIEEDTPLETQVALDPEMLGKVFENLLEVEERGKSGTFYTPRAVVAFMCRESLAAYLSRTVDGLAADHLGWLLDEAETGEPVRDEQTHERLTTTNMPSHLRHRIEVALVAVRALDPAVGSGAFPLGMLALLVGVRRALYRIAEAKIEPHSALIQDWKRAFIRDCLYGVDIRREAIEIARLRLWLSLVVDADPFHMEPLPNLDYKLMDGNSLIETLDGVAIYPTHSSDTLAQQTLIGDEERQKLIAHLKELQKEYYQPEHPADRAELKRRVRETEVAMVKRSLRQRKEDETTRLNQTLAKLANLKLGSNPEPRDLAAERVALTHSIEMTDAALRDLATDASLPFFLYRLHFASVFEERGGFDIVIANPPYVRHEKIAPATLVTLKTAYRDVAHGMADLYVYFYARALQLLHDGGTLCFISSNKFFRAGYGKGLRGKLATETSVRTIIDFGDFPVFDAAAYPCVVITDKAAPTADHTYRGLTAGPDIELDKIGIVLDQHAQTCAQDGDVQPPSGSAETSALVKKLMALGKPFGEFTNGNIYYGVKTGLNEAFVVDEATRDRLVADPGSAEVLKPFLRGRDVSRYRITSARLWLIRIETGWTVAQLGGKKAIEQVAWEKLKSIYPAIAAHLAPFAERARQRDDQGQYWWELRPCVYYNAFEQPKIVYPDIASEARFIWDEDGYYTDTTMFCVPSGTRVRPWLVTLLNSAVQNFALFTISPAIRGGFSRFKTQYVERLPIVEPSESDKQRLEALVDQLQAIGGGGPQAEAFEREVDQIVYRTYGLTPDEIAEIERWHADRKALLGKGKRTGKESADSVDVERLEVTENVEESE